jgi:hypothetical protein
MKNQTRILLASAFVSLFLLFSCQTREQEIESARMDVAESKQTLNQAIIDSTEDYNNFKLQSELRIKQYEEKIAELKVKIAKEKRSSRTASEKTLADLDRRNELMKQNLKEYKATGKNNWEMFKVNVNSSLDSLGNSITDFFSVNQKK